MISRIEPSIDLLYETSAYWNEAIGFYPTACVLSIRLSTGRLAVFRVDDMSTNLASRILCSTEERSAGVT